MVFMQNGHVFFIICEERLDPFCAPTVEKRAASTHKLSYLSTTSSSYHKSYFNRIIRLWNSMPVIDLTLSLSTIKTLLTNYLWTNFSANFISDYTCTFHMLCPCYRCSKLPIISNYQPLTNFRTS